MSVNYVFHHHFFYFPKITLSLKFQVFNSKGNSPRPRQPIAGIGEERAELKNAAFVTRTEKGACRKAAALTQWTLKIAMIKEVH